MKSTFAFALAGAVANLWGVMAAPGRSPLRGSSAALGASTLTNTHWSGSLLSGQGITNVEGSFVIPNVSGQDPNDSVAVWVGIDGAGGGNCGNTLMQAGILIYGDGTIRPWYEWWPEESIQFFDQGWDVAAGDNIYMKVTADSTSSGVATLTNQRTGQSLTHQFTPSESPGDLCEVHGEWIVEAISFGNSFATLPQFGTITFTDTLANTSQGTATADNGQIINMAGYQDNNVNCQHAGSGSVSCTRA